MVAGSVLDVAPVNIGCVVVAGRSTASLILEQALLSF